MILTRDNILRFVRDKKAVTPTMVSEAFDTTTMIASAALSEIAKDKLILITKLKLASSPYYYDPKQRECLIELGDKHLSKGEKDVFNKIRDVEILSDNSLTIQDKLAIEKIQDFAIPLKVGVDGKTMLFWVWYLRDINETKKQILVALKPEVSEKKVIKKEVKKKTKARKPVKDILQSQLESYANVPNDSSRYRSSNSNNYFSGENKFNQQQSSQGYNDNSNNSLNQFSNESHMNQQQMNNESRQTDTAIKFKPVVGDEQGSKIEDFIESFFRDNYLSIDNKNKEDKGILYQTSLLLNNMKIEIDCFYFYKKTTDADLIKFYTSSLKPKIVFIVNCPKKLLKLSDSIENLTIVNI